MERQLLSLLGNGSAGTAGAAAQGPSGSQPQQGGTRQSGRARQQRDLSEAAIEEARRRQWDAGLTGNGAAEEEEEEEEGADAAGEGGAGGGSTGLLVCGFSPDGTHIVAGGNDCSVYVWQWEVPSAGSAAQQHQQRQQHLAVSPAGRGSSRLAGATPGVPAGQAAAAAAAALPTSPGAAGQLQGAGAACEAESAEMASEAAALEAALPGAAADARQQHSQPLPASQQQGQQARRQPALAGAIAAEDAPWPVPKEVCQLKGHRNDAILLQFSHAGDRVATGSKDGSVRVRQPGCLVLVQWMAAPQLRAECYTAYTVLCNSMVRQSSVRWPGFLSALLLPAAVCDAHLPLARSLAGVAPAPALAQAGAGVGAGGHLCCAARPRGDQRGPAAAAAPAGAFCRPDCLERG